MSRYVFPIVGLISLLAACTVGPNFQPPAAPAEEAYAVQDELLGPAQRIALGKALEQDWWRLFASEPLNDLMQQAMADNNTIAAARQSVLQAQEAVKAANGALMPQISLDGSVARQKFGVAMFGASDFKIPPFTAYQLGPRATWTLDFFGGNARRVEHEKALMAYQLHQLDAAYVTLTANVATAALEAAAAAGEIAAVEKIIAEDQKTLDLVEKAYKAGAETNVNILSVRSQLENNKAMLPPLKQRQSVARHALSVLLGQAPANWKPPVFTLDSVVLPKELPVALPSELVRQRPDILAAEDNLRAASAAIGIATANLYPKITINANFMQEALVPGRLFDRDNGAWGVAGGLSAPIVNGGTLAAEKRAAQFAYEAAQAQYRETVLQAFRQVADALTAVQHDAELMAAQQQAYTTARTSLDLRRKSFTEGDSNLLQVQEAERQLAQAELGVVRARSQSYQTIVALFVALGGSAPPHEW